MSTPFVGPEDSALTKAINEADADAPPAPERPHLGSDAPLTKLRKRVADTLLAMPAHFRFDTSIEGVNATDLQSANTLLGASIEVQVVATLNRLRELWDPGLEWQGYRFERQSQTFPDVRLIRHAGERVDNVLGIELKGWYLFSKEGVPTFRFTSTAAACAPHDLICVVPWHFSNVTSGTPVARDPWVESARWAAEYRNYWWTYIRKSKANRGVLLPEGAHPYPTKDMQISDRPEYDGGNNFGRLARVKGLMDTFIDESMKQEALGIPIRNWVSFFGLHIDSADAEEVYASLSAELEKHRGFVSRGQARKLTRLIRQVREVFDPPG